MGFLSGLFGGKKEQLAAPKYKTAEELFNEASSYARGQFPEAYGAREGALSDLGRGSSYYEEFQPTSFEQALQAQNFANIWPDVQRQIRGGLSLTGMEYSPLLAELEGRERSKLGVDIGSYLTNLGNERARYSLSSRLGIDPMGMTLPYANMNQGQSNLQTTADYDDVMQRYLQDQQEKQGMMSSLFQLGGAGIGLALGGPPGAMLGSSIGGMAAPIFGGGANPIDIGDALSVYSLLNKPKSASPTSTGVGSSAFSPVSNTMNKSYYPDYSSEDYNFGGGDFLSSIKPRRSWQDDFRRPKYLFE